MRNYFTKEENIKRIDCAIADLVLRHAELSVARRTMTGSISIDVDNWLDLIVAQAVKMNAILKKIKAGKITQPRTIAQKADYEVPEAHDLIKRTARYI